MTWKDWIIVGGVLFVCCAYLVWWGCEIVRVLFGGGKYGQ